jgi:putative ABC transport system substrate-binding protein
MTVGALALLAALTLGTLTAPLTAGAQQAAKVPRIGVLHPGTPAGSSHLFEAFKQGLREHGYVEGRSIILERRYGEARAERISELAAELVRIKVDLIVTSTDVGIAAVKQQTQTIPIVMANSTDPVGTGFVASLARPGGNVTGFSMMVPELSAKRLELLKEVAPGLSRVAIIWNPEVRGGVLDYKETEAAARSLRLQLQSVEVSRADDFNRAFSAVASGRAEALIVSVLNPPAFANRDQIVSFAQRNRLPSMYGLKEFADAGGLMAYGPNAAELWRRAATYVDKILKGAKPGELSVEQPNKFELVINLKTAKALGLTIPQSLLRRADHVIQ